jgi:hypothetical protein
LDDSISSRNRLLKELQDLDEKLEKQANRYENLEGQKNDLEGQLKELWAKLEASENDEKEANMKVKTKNNCFYSKINFQLEKMKKTAEFDKLLVRIEKENGQKVEWEEKMKAMEKRFEEEKEFKIAQVIFP